MSKVLLTDWQATELFFRIAHKAENCKDIIGGSDAIPKLENNSYSAIEDSAYQSRLMKKYSKKEECIRVTKLIWPESNISGNSTSKFFLLGLAVRSLIPFTITDDEKDSFLAFVDHTYEISPEHRPNEWAPSEKAVRMIENTSWQFYHYSKSDDLPGIVEGTIKLYPFNRAELFTFSDEQDDPVVMYAGKWSRIEKVFLLLEMRVKTSDSRDLHILFYIGDESPSLAVGLYHNVDLKHIYSGTIMIVPKDGTEVNLNDKNEVIPKARFIASKDKVKSENKYIQQCVWNFCENVSERLLAMPLHILTTKQLETVLDKKKYSNTTKAIPTKKARPKK